MSELLKKANLFQKEHMHEADEERPLFHITGGIGWINDPNGFSYYQDTYHMFYQYYPYDTYWGPMHWGHVVSKDLIKWEFKDVVMAPDQEYDTHGVFSGTAITMDDGKQLLMYTSVDKNECQTQSVAIGDGNQYTKYQNNPVIGDSLMPEYINRIECRDPKIWKEGDIYYCVVVGMDQEGYGRMLLYKSKDCFTWEFVSTFYQNHDFGKMWECPDYFRLQNHDVVILNPCNTVSKSDEYHGGHNTVCFVGERDIQSNTFTSRWEHNLDYGLDFYAPQTIKDPKGRRIIVGWMANWANAKKKRAGVKLFGCMSLPRTLEIVGNRVIQNPIGEIENYYTSTLEKEVLIQEETQVQDIQGRYFDMTLEIPTTTETRFTIKLTKRDNHYFSVEYDGFKNAIVIDRTYDGNNMDINHIRRKVLYSRRENTKLRIIMDRNCIEIFVNDGENVFSSVTFAPIENDEVTFEANKEVSMKVLYNTFK